VNDGANHIAVPLPCSPLRSGRQQRRGTNRRHDDADADIVLDYRETDFETILKDYDIVLNSLGGDTFNEISAGTETRWTANLNI
jgi:hypothetical protein